MPNRPQAESPPETVPFQLRAARLGYKVLGGIAPGLTARWATAHFLQSRSRGVRRSHGLPLGARKFRLRGNGAETYGYMWGASGPIVLLVHGWGADSNAMFSMIKPLAEQGFRVAAFDAPGHGLSPEKSTTMTGFVQRVGDVLDTLGDVRAVVAHSLGGIAAVAAASRRAGRGETLPDRMVLLSAPCNLPTVVDIWAKFLHVGPRTVAGMTGELNRLNGVPPAHWDIAELGQQLAGVPILVVHDEDDQLVPFAEAEKIAAALSGVGVEKTAGLGHRRILFAPQVHKSIAAFLAPVGEASAERPD